MRDSLSAFDPLPLTLGAKVEKPRLYTEAESSEAGARLFERVAHDLIVKREGDSISVAFVDEADCRQVKRAQPTADADGWIAWNPGDGFPASLGMGTLIEARTDDPASTFCYRAHCFKWDQRSPLRAYRLV